MKLAMDSALVLVFINFLWAVHTPCFGVNKHASGFVQTFEVRHKTIPECTYDHCCVRSNHTDQPKQSSDQVRIVTEIILFSEKLLIPNLSPISAPMMWSLMPRAPTSIAPCRRGQTNLVQLSSTRVNTLSVIWAPLYTVAMNIHDCWLNLHCWGGALLLVFQMQQMTAYNFYISCSVPEADRCEVPILTNEVSSMLHIDTTLGLSNILRKGINLSPFFRKQMRCPFRKRCCLRWHVQLTVYTYIHVWYSTCFQWFFSHRFIWNVFNTFDIDDFMSSRDATFRVLLLLTKYLMVETQSLGVICHLTGWVDAYIWQNSVTWPESSAACCPCTPFARLP